MRTRDRVRQLNRLIGEQVWMEPMVKEGKVVLAVASNRGKVRVVEDDDADVFLGEWQYMQDHGQNAGDLFRLYFEQ